MPWDSTATSAWVSEWIWTGVLRDAVFTWMDAHREALRDCHSPRDIEALPGWRQGVLEVVYAQAERRRMAIGESRQKKKRPNCVTGSSPKWSERIGENRHRTKF